MHGVPVVMYDLPNLSLTKDQRGILTAEWGNVRDLADKLSYILANSEYCKKLGEEGQLSLEEFSDDKILNQWNIIFDRVIGGHRLGVELNGYQTNDNYRALVIEMMRSWNFFMKRNYWKFKVFKKIEQHVPIEWLKRLIRNRWPDVF